MEIKNAFFQQFGKPTGALGKFVGWLMALKNKERNEWILQQLDIKPNNRILEVGFGPGLLFRAIASKLSTGFIAGIDHSEAMHKVATHKNKKSISEKIAVLQTGTVWDLKHEENSFDIIVGSNVHFFWDKPLREFLHLKKFLKPQGRLAMIFQPMWAKSPEHITLAANDVRNNLEMAGYKRIILEFKDMKPMCISAIAWKL